MRVAGAGLCHSDLHLMRWPAGSLPYELPFTLGHEVSGTVAALGAGADGLEPGEPVLVYGPWGCGGCRACSIGAEHLCERAPSGRGAGLGRDGGLAEYMVVPSPRLTVPLGGLDPVSAAPLADAGLTPYHAVRRALGLLRPGTSAIVIGVGGLGHVAVQLLKALSPARVVAVDRRDEALDLAAHSGADVALRGGGAGRTRAAARRRRPRRRPGRRLRRQRRHARRWPPAAWPRAATSRCSAWAAGRSRCASATCRWRPR